MLLAFTVSKLSNWHFQFGDMDNVNVRSVGHAWEITLSTCASETSTSTPRTCGGLSGIVRQWVRRLLRHRLLRFPWLL
ncbi:unnamed protein product [Caenorhabditis brenneri]